jgi:hypothetical protein
MFTLRALVYKASRGFQICLTCLSIYPHSQNADSKCPIGQTVSHSRMIECVPAFFPNSSAVGSQARFLRCQGYASRQK